jgi:hypothetical protein
MFQYQNVDSVILNLIYTQFCLVLTVLKKQFNSVDFKCVEADLGFMLCYSSLSCEFFNMSQYSYIFYLLSCFMSAINF